VVGRVVGGQVADVQFQGGAKGGEVVEADVRGERERGRLG
jgi:hypothetical protein